MSTLEVNNSKVLHTKELLIEIINEPVKFKNDHTLKTSLKSQIGLAKYINKERLIYQCSLNTLKTASELLLERGFIELNELRINARDALESASFHKHVKSHTREALKNKIDLLQIQLTTMQKSNFLLSTIIDELRGQLTQLADINKSREQVRAMHIEYNKRLEAKLSFAFDNEV